MFLSKPFFPYMPQEEPPVSLLTLEMEFHTLSPSLMVTPFPTESKELTSPEETLLTTWLN